MYYNSVADSNCNRRFKVNCNLITRKTSFCVFETPIGGLGTTYDVRLRLIGKLIVMIIDFPLMLIELFVWLGVTAEALQANID